MEIDIASKQGLFDAIKLAAKKGEGKVLYALCTQISLNTLALKKEAKTAKTALLAVEKELSDSKVVVDEDVLHLPPNATDAEITVRTRQFLIKKLNNDSLSAAEIAQLKDLFGLTNAVQDINISVQSYRELCEDCPRMQQPELTPA